MIINNIKIYIIIFSILIFLLFAFRFHGTYYKFDPNVCELPMKWKHSAGTFEEIQSTNAIYYPYFDNTEVSANTKLAYSLTYTANTDLDSTYGDNKVLSGTISTSTDEVLLDASAADTDEGAFLLLEDNDRLIL